MCALGLQAAYSNTDGSIPAAGSGETRLALFHLEGHANHYLQLSVVPAQPEP